MAIRDLYPNRLAYIEYAFDMELIDQLLYPGKRRQSAVKDVIVDLLQEFIPGWIWGNETIKIGDSFLYKYYGLSPSQCNRVRSTLQSIGVTKLESMSIAAGKNARPSLYSVNYDFLIVNERPFKSRGELYGAVHEKIGFHGYCQALSLVRSNGDRATAGKVLDAVIELHGDRL